MKRLLFSGAALAAATMAVPAQAAPIFYYTTGSTFPFSTSAAVFQSFENAPSVGTGTPYVAGTGAPLPPGITESVSGSDVRVQTGNVPGISADPDPANTGGTKFLDIVNGSYTVNFASPVQFFSFLFGSLDTYNSLALTFGGVTTTYNGTALAALIGAGGGPATTFDTNGNSSTSGRLSVTADGGAGLSRAVFSSSQAAFEIDALASAVPEPGAWMLMILGVGLAGGSLRTRRRKVTFATA